MHPTAMLSRDATTPLRPRLMILAPTETAARRLQPILTALAAEARHSTVLAPDAGLPEIASIEPGEGDVVAIVEAPAAGLSHSTRRLILLASLLGAVHIVIVIETPGQDDDATPLLAIRCELEALPLAQSVLTRAAIPLSPDALAAHLASLPPRERAAAPLRLRISSIAPAGVGRSTISGDIVQGAVTAADRVILARTGHAARVLAMAGADDGPLERAVAGSHVTLTLDSDTGANVGDLLAGLEHRPDVADQFAAHLAWTGAEPMLPGRQYVLDLAGRRVLASVTDLKHVTDLTDLGRMPAKALRRGEIGLCNFALSEPLAFDASTDCPATGSFTLLDRDTHETAGAGLIQFALRRATNIQIQRIEIDKAARAALKGQRPVVVWFTGLSGAGKTTIANRLESRLVAQGRHTYLMDGDNLRHGLNRDLGFLPADRVENMRRVGEVARLMLDAGLIVLVSLISPFRSERQMVRELIGADDFVEVFVDASITTCRKRDPKGLYKKADEGKIANFTGVTSPYEAPPQPDVRLAADTATADELADLVLAHLAAR